jgi:pimeloyl-ACP methyl ester carboxylesterase
MSTTTLTRIVALIALVATISGCATTGETPMAALRYGNTQSNAAEDKKLLILLRGAGGGNDVFKNKGLVDQVISSGLPFDIVAPDAHTGYYASKTLERRLYEDIILPARRQGYREIWVAGTSMGGLGALLLQIEYPDAVDGIILLSPFLGWPGIVKEIRNAGGLESWQPGTHTIEDWQRYLWAWIKRYQQSPDHFPPIYLGYGNSDFFSDSQSLLADALPEEHTIIVSGGHTYGTMRRLWNEYLERLGPELRCCSKALTSSTGAPPLKR